MQWHGLKLPVIFLAFVFGLALAFGGQWGYKEFIFEKPLNKVLAENKLVENFKVEEKGTQSVVKVTLSKEAPNLMNAYQELNQLTGEVIGKKPYDLEITSKPDNSLEQAYYQSQYVIYQAQVAGNFPEVVQKVQESANKYGAAGKVYVDQNNIYIQMTKSDGYYINKIIPRQGGSDLYATSQGGGQGAKGN